MKHVLLAASVGLFAVAENRFAPTPSPNVLKDRAALMVYQGRDQVLALVVNADSANIALILLHQWEGEPVPTAQLGDRPCVGVALFSKTEWAQLTSTGRKLTEIRPREAAMRMRIYAAKRDLPEAVQNIENGTARVAIGLRAAEKWSIRAYVDSATGPCTVE